MLAEERSAWLLDFGANLRAIVGGQHLAEYLRKPQVTEVPLAPLYALGVLTWRGQLLPLIDLARLNENSLNHHDLREQVMGSIVLAYRETTRAALQYGALALASAPREIKVRDDMICELPLQPVFLSAIAASCITYDNQALPILRVRNIFTQLLQAEPNNIPSPLQVLDDVTQTISVQHVDPIDWQT